MTPAPASYRHSAFGIPFLLSWLRHPSFAQRTHSLQFKRPNAHKGRLCVRESSESSYNGQHFASLRSLTHECKESTDH